MTGHSASRRVVTVVFADVVGSTALAERLDPEVTRGVLTRFYESARQILGGHGGTVEKFIGDAVMAVFGIPELHEDDALRAAAAALALRDVMGAESDRLSARYDVRLDLRIGIATGEVAVGDPAHGTTLVTGDAVNVAARLQGAAQPGDILIAPATRRLLRSSARVEALEPLVLKGKAEPVAACRLLAVDVTPPDVGQRPMVGRSGESDTIRDALQRAIDERRPGLVTVLGAPGIGKSRLLAAVLPRFAASATIVEGHCLAYGEGITYWPIAEVVRSLAGIDDRDPPEVARGSLDAVLADATDGPAVAAQLAAAIGLGSEGGAGDQTPWAVRRLLEVVAGRRPLIVVIEDVQWADPVLLDLLEYVLGWAAAVPAVVVTLARPELRERRPDWGTAVDGAVSLTLRPLTPDVIADLVVDRTDASVPPAVIDHVVRASDGNPLFADELLTMLLEDGHVRRGDDGWLVGDLERVPVPPTIGALLAARLDRLPVAERDMLQVSSVVGERFDALATRELAPPDERATVPASLLALVRKELLRPDRSDLLGGDAFRFRHLLVRDIAYDSLPKTDRAHLHEQFADWLIQLVGDRLPEFEAIVGYHLEQAYRYHHALGTDGHRPADLARRAAGHLAAGGRRAAEVDDVASASSLLGRAIALLLPGDPELAQLRIDLLLALAIGGRATGALEAADDLAADPPTEPVAAGRARAAVELARRVATTVPAVDQDALVPLTEELDRLGDDLALAYVWHARSLDTFWNSQMAPGLHARSVARQHARRAGAGRVERLVLFALARFYGPTPVEEGIADAERELAQAGADRHRRATILADRGGLLALTGDIEAGRSAARALTETLQDLGLRLYAAGSVELLLEVERVAGDPALAIEALQASNAELAHLDAPGYEGHQLRLLGLALASAGRWDEVRAILHRFDTEDRLRTDPSDDTWELWIRAMADEAEGRLPEAIVAAERAVETIARTDLVTVQADGHLLLARLCARAGDDARAAEHAAMAEAIAVAKGYRRGTERARAILAEVASAAG